MVKRTSLSGMPIGLLLVGLLFGLGCGSAGPPAGAGSLPSGIDDRTLGTGGQITVGIRVALDGDDEHAGQVRLEAVTMDMDGVTEVTDLGFFEGEVSQLNPAPSELGHLRLQQGAEFHDLVLLETLNPNRLELRMDGELLLELDVPNHQVLEPQQPFLLRPGDHW